MSDGATIDLPSVRSAPALPLSSRPQLLSDRIANFAAEHKWLLGGFLLLLYAAGFNGQWRVEPDSALYLILGRNLASGAGYSYQGTAQHLAFPGLPLLFALLFKLFGTRSLLPALIVMPCLGVAALALTYRLFLLHADRATATMVTFGVATTRLFYRYCFELLTDLPFLVAVMAFLVGYEAIFFAPYRADRPRRARWFDWALLVGGLAGAAVTRPVMYMLFVTILVTLVLKLFARDVRKGPIVQCMLLVVAAAIGFYLFDKRREHGSHAMGEYEEALFQALPHFRELIHRAVFEFLPRIFEASASQAVFGCRLLPGLNSAIAIWVFGAIVYLFRARVLWGIWVIGNIALMLIVVKPLDRYFLPTLPLLIFAWWRSIQWVDRNIRQPHGWRLFLTLLLFGAGTNFSRIGEMIVEQRRRPFLNYYHEGYFAAIKPVSRMVSENTLPDDWVLVGPKLGRILTFYSDRWAANTPQRQRKHLAQGKVWLLSPAGEHVDVWLKENGYNVSEPVAPPIYNSADRTLWKLSHVERTAPPLPPTPTTR